MWRRIRPSSQAKTAVKVTHKVQKGKANSKCDTSLAASCRIVSIYVFVVVWMNNPIIGVCGGGDEGGGGGGSGDGGGDKSWVK